MENETCSQAPHFLSGACGHVSTASVNGAQSNRHDTASRRGVTGARGVNPVKPCRGVLPDGQNDASDGQPERCRAREREERQAGLAADQANGRDVCTVGAHSRRIARRFWGRV